MKLTKKALKQLIKEELEDLQEFSMDEPMAGVGGGDDYIQDMEEDIRENTRQIQEIFRVLKKNGIYRPGI